MAQVLSFFRRPAAAPSGSAAIADLLSDFSIEDMPRTAAKIDDFRAILPAGTRVYLAHIDGTDFADMLATARRLADALGLVALGFTGLGGELERLGFRHQVGVERAGDVADVDHARLHRACGGSGSRLERSGRDHEIPPTAGAHSYRRHHRPLRCERARAPPHHPLARRAALGTARPKAQIRRTWMSHVRRGCGRNPLNGDALV